MKRSSATVATLGGENRADGSYEAFVGVDQSGHTPTLYLATYTGPSITSQGLRLQPKQLELDGLVELGKYWILVETRHERGCRLLKKL